MSGNGITMAGAVGSGSTNHVGQGPVGLNEIKICRCDVFQLMTEIAHEGDAFQKYFGKNYR